MFDWKKYNSRKRFLVIFSILSIVSLAIVAGIGIIYISEITDLIESDSRKALSSQTRTNSEIIVKEATDLFRKTLISATEGFLLMYSTAMADTYRSDYSMGFSPSYLDWTVDFLAPPLVIVPPYTEQVSLSGSSYYVPDIDPSDIPTFSLTMNVTRDRGANLDPYFRPTFQNNPGFVAGYVALEVPVDDSAVFRHFPGVSTLSTDPNREYDPRIRGWYLDAMANPSKTIYSSPYSDFNGKGWMITPSTVVRNIETGEIVGVAGADLLIEEIQNNINAIQFLDSGKVTLFQTDGTVVSDPSWNPQPTDSFGIRYNQLNRPEITDELWSQISTAPLDQTETIDYSSGGEDYLVTYLRISDFNGQYVMVITVPKSEIFAPIDEIINDIDSTSKKTSGTVGGIFVGCIVIVTLLAVLLANTITRPIGAIRNMTHLMNQNLGRGDLTEGIGKGTAAQTGIEEIDSLIKDAGDFFQQVKDKEKQSAIGDDMMENPEYVANAILPQAIQGNLSVAEQWYKHALTCAPMIDHTIKNSIKAHLADCLEQQGKHEEAIIYRKFRNLTFVLDVSGSMAGGKLRQCKKSIQNIVREYVRPRDHISLITFDSNVYEKFELQAKSTHEAEFLNIVNGIDAGSMTAFYDALLMAIHKEINDKNPREDWIVALTDGADNKSSRRSFPNIIRTLDEHPEVTLVVITVGNEVNLGDISEICPKGSAKRIHLKVDDNADAIRQAFDKVATMMTTTQLSIEAL